MVSVVKKTNQIGIDTYEVYCLSGDTKPVKGMTNGSTCFEMDTSKAFSFDEENALWRPM